MNDLKFEVMVAFAEAEVEFKTKKVERLKTKMPESVCEHRCALVNRVSTTYTGHESAKTLGIAFALDKDSYLTDVLFKRFGVSGILPSDTIAEVQQKVIETCRCKAIATAKEIIERWDVKSSELFPEPTSSSSIH